MGVSKLERSSLGRAFYLRIWCLPYVGNSVMASYLETQYIASLQKTNHPLSYKGEGCGKGAFFYNIHICPYFSYIREAKNLSFISNLL